VEGIKGTDKIHIIKLRTLRRLTNHNHRHKMIHTTPLHNNDEDDVTTMLKMKHITVNNRMIDTRTMTTMNLIMTIEGDLHR
jgi:hypothetical protein